MMKMLEGSKIAYIWNVKDVDKKEGMVNFWWKVALEPKEQDVVQTVEMCVTFDLMNKAISRFLVEGGWYKVGDEVKYVCYDNQTSKCGYGGVFVVEEVNPVRDELAELEKWLGEFEGNVGSAKLGKALFEYVEGNVYDVDWEGFTQEELKGVVTFLRDFKVACEAGLVKKEG